MAIKFSKITNGMTLYQKKVVRLGNTTMTEEAIYEVHVVEVDTVRNGAWVHWNVTFNPREFWLAARLERLYAKPPKTREEKQRERDAVLAAAYAKEGA